MIIVKQRGFRVIILDKSYEHYSSLRELTDAVKSYSFKKLKEIISMKLISSNGSPEPLPEGW